MKRKDLEISSRQNAKFKLWQSLLEAKGIKSEGLCLVSGAKVVAELIAAGQIVELILPPKSKAPEADIPVIQLTGELFNELDVIGTKAPLAVARVTRLKNWTGGAAEGLDLILALSDPSNLGALLRSCEAFGVTRVILTKECASPFLPRAIRASAGSVFRLPLFVGPALKEIPLESAFGLDLNGPDISAVDWPTRMYLVLGEEGQGLPEELAVQRVRIPMARSIESLNAMAAASIALFSYRQKHPL